MTNNETKKVLIEEINSTKRISTTPIFNLNYCDGTFVEILGGDLNEVYDVQIFDNHNIVHRTSLRTNHWTKTNRKYFMDSVIKIYDSKANLVAMKTLDFKDRRVYIAIESKSIGDNLAWVPYLEEFRKKHGCHLIASTFFNELFNYPNIEFVQPGTIVEDLTVMYSIGYYYDGYKEPELPNTIPLQKQASNILGLIFKEIKPILRYESDGVSTKTITIAPHSTAGLKYWTNSGWQDLIDYLTSLGYEVINVAREGCDFKGVTNLEDYSLDNIMQTINRSKLFIGLGSGLSWLAWSLNKKVVMINNFSDKDHEFTTGVTRITNDKSCSGCWNNKNFKFDKGDWNWCPINKGTNKQFECMKSITAGMVIEKIKYYEKL